MKKKRKAQTGWLNWLRDAATEQFELKGAHLVGAELIGRAVEMPGEAGDAGHIRFNGSRRVVAQTEVVDDTLPQRGNDASPRMKRGGTNPPAYVEREANRSAKNATGVNEMKVDAKVPYSPRSTSARPPLSGLVQLPLFAVIYNKGHEKGDNVPHVHLGRSTLKIAVSAVFPFAFHIFRGQAWRMNARQTPASDTALKLGLAANDTNT